MPLKRVLTAVLVTFVVLAIAFVVRDVRAPEDPAAARPAPVSSTPPVARAQARPIPEPAAPVEATAPQTRRVAAVKEAPPAQARKVVATYFHGDVRCVTCRKVEAYAREAVAEGFGPQIAAGTVEFRAVNVDEAANRHFIEDFRLTNKSVVVTDEADGVVRRWVKLDDVWSLVGDRDAYVTYVQDGVRGYLETE